MEEAEKALISILPLVFVVVMIIGVVAWFFGSRGGEDEEEEEEEGVETVGGKSSELEREITSIRDAQKKKRRLFGLRF